MKAEGCDPRLAFAPGLAGLAAAANGGPGQPNYDLAQASLRRFMTSWCAFMLAALSARR